MILLISPKKVYATERFMAESRNLNIPVEALDVRDLVGQGMPVDVSHYSALYIRQVYPYFEQAIGLARQFWEAGKYVVDGDSILSGFETSREFMYERLDSAGVTVPATVPFFNLPSTLHHHPCILKWNYGFGGSHVHLVQSSDEARSVLTNHNPLEWLAQEYIDADFEYKVVTVGYKSLPKMLRFKISDLGYKIDLHKYSIIDAEHLSEVVALAEKSARVLGRELAKTDILEKDCKLYVLETNRSPGFLPI